VALSLLLLAWAVLPLMVVAKKALESLFEQLPKIVTANKDGGFAAFRN
jgi:hypothetical protein